MLRIAKIGKITKAEFFNSAASSIAVMAACLAASAPAFAAEKNASDSAASQAVDTPSDSTGGDIVVTAQRRSESLQKVPLAVTAITPERAEQFNLRDVPDLKLITPALQFNTGINYAQTFIRGVGYPNTTPGVETSVATYIDGAYLERGFGTIFDVVDAGSLQVLKGPQGTLWGRNATGGAILINTADPEFSTGGRALAEYGNQGHWMGEGVLNAALSDTVAVRVAGRYREDGGYIRNLADGSKLGSRENWVLRGKVLFQPTNDFKAVAQVQLDRSKRSEGANAEFLPAGFCAFCAGSEYTLPVSDPYTTVVNRLNNGVGGRDKSEFYNLRMSYNTGPVSLSSVTAYRKTNNFETGDFDFTEVPGFNVAQFSGSKTFTQDLTANVDISDAVTGTAGVSYLHDKSYIFLDIYSANTLPDSHLLVNNVTTESVSAFAEGTAEIVPNLKLTAGGRYTHDKRSSLAQNVSFNKFTPRVVLAYDAGQFNLYASYNRGYKAGGFSTPAGNPLNIYQPETIDSYEVGVKFLSNDRRLRVNLAAFHYNHKDLQVLAVDQGNVDNISQTQNASSKADGFELEGDFKVNDVLQLLGGISYLSGKYSQFEGAIVQRPIYDAQGAPAGLETGPEDLTGHRLPQAPEWTAFAGVTVNVPVGTWNGRLTGLVRYSSSFDFYPGGGGPLRADMQPGYTTAKLTGQLTSPDERYTVGFFINNLTDKTYYDFRYTTAPFGGMQNVARPRTFGVQLGVKFGS